MNNQHSKLAMALGLAAQDVPSVERLLPPDFLRPDEKEKLLELQSKWDRFQEQLKRCNQSIIESRLAAERDAYSKDPLSPHALEQLLNGAESVESMRGRYAQAERHIHFEATRFTQASVVPVVKGILTRAIDFIREYIQQFSVAESQAYDVIGISFKPSYRLVCLERWVLETTQRVKHLESAGLSSPRSMLQNVVSFE